MKIIFSLIPLAILIFSRSACGSAVPAQAMARTDEPFTLLEGGVTNIETGEVTSLSPIAEGVPELRSLDTSSAGSSLDRRLGQLVLTCYNEGTPVNRGVLTTVIDYWCSNYMIGRTVSPGNEYWSRFYTDQGSVLVSLNMFTPSPCGSSVVDGACNVNLRYPVDQCDTSSVTRKRGGYVKDSCAIWRIDPGMYQIHGNDY